MFIYFGPKLNFESSVTWVGRDVIIINIMLIAIIIYIILIDIVILIIIRVS